MIFREGSTGWSFARGLSILFIFCRMSFYPVDHFQEVFLSCWSFIRGLSILFIIRNSWSIRMIICKRPVHPDDHLQEAGPSGWSFARGRSIRMIICKRPVHLDDHLQKAGPSGWSFAKQQQQRGGRKGVWSPGWQGGPGPRGEKEEKKEKAKEKKEKKERKGNCSGWDDIEGSIRGPRALRNNQISLSIRWNHLHIIKCAKMNNFGKFM